MNDILVASQVFATVVVIFVGIPALLHFVLVPFVLAYVNLLIWLFSL